VLTTAELLDLYLTLQFFVKYNGHINITVQRIPPLYNNTVNGTLAVDGSAVTFGIARRGLGGLQPPPPISLVAVPNDIVTANPVGLVGV